jgi:hypothetical protein
LERFELSVAIERLERLNQPLLVGAIAVGSLNFVEKVKSEPDSKLRIAK